MTRWEKFKWSWRIRKAWKDANGNWGQFHSTLGYYIACGYLPKMDELSPLWKDINLQ